MNTGVSQLIEILLLVALAQATLQPLVPATIEATLPIPWTADYSFDEETFAAALATVVSNLTQHVYLYGTAGEHNAYRFVAHCTPLVDFALPL